MAEQSSNTKEERRIPELPRILIIDPRNFTDNLLSTDTKSKLVRVAAALKKFSEKWFSHVLLLGVLILYTIIGAAIFQAIEGPYEESQKAPIKELRDEILKKLWDKRSNYTLPTRMNQPEPRLHPSWEFESKKLLLQFEETVTRACTAGVTTDSDEKMWSFLGSLFFSMTIYTTIGYGENPPKTTAGRTVTMIYAFIGIPLLLMVLADFGKLFTRGIKFLFKFIRRLYYTRSFKHVRSVGRKATHAPIQVVDALNRGIAFIPYMPQIPINRDSEEKTDEKEPKKVQSGYRTPAFWYAAQHPNFRPEMLRTPMILTSTPSPPRSASPIFQSPGINPDDPESPMPEDDFEVDDEFNLPVTLALSMLLIYKLLGAVLFWLLEEWTLFEAFYFVFISMSTIGFGDFVPTFKYMIGSFIYLLFGLALTSMCINVVQEKLSSTFERAKMTIGETIGLDVEQIMAAEMSEEKSDKSRDTSAEKSMPSKEGSVESKVPFKLKEEGFVNSLKEKREMRRSPKSDISPSNDAKETSVKLTNL